MPRRKPHNAQFLHSDIAIQEGNDEQPNLQRFVARKNEPSSSLPSELGNLV
jgi:hypothetical protein